LATTRNSGGNSWWLAEVSLVSESELDSVSVLELELDSVSVLELELESDLSNCTLLQTTIAKKIAKATRTMRIMWEFLMGT
jgi:hypothetical protein